MTQPASPEGIERQRCLRQVYARVEVCAPSAGATSFWRRPRAVAPRWQPFGARHLEKAEQPQTLAQRIPIDPEQAGRLELIAPGQIESLAEKGSLDPRHHAPVQLAALRGRRLAHQRRQRRVHQRLEVVRRL